jgi:macrolide-specific efflux system membrane fusion protein
MTQPGPAGLPDPPTPQGPTRPRGRNRRALVLVLGAVVVLLIVALVIVPHFTSGNSSSASDQPQLATAAIQSFPITLTASATVVPASEVAVNFATSGQLAQINVQVNQKVTKGTVLAELNSSVAQSDIARAQAVVTSANAALAAAEAPLTPGEQTTLQAAISAAQAVLTQTQSSVSATNSEDLAAINADKQHLAADGCSATGPSNALICQNEQSTLDNDQTRAGVDASNGQREITQAQNAVTQAQAALTAASTPNPNTVSTAKAAVASADAQLQAAQAELANLSLVAPANGTVLVINGQPGETVSGAANSSGTLPGTTAPFPQVAGLSSSSGSSNLPLFILGNTGSYVVGAAFPSTALPQLAAHQSGTITDASLNGLSVPCSVLAVAQDPTTVNTSSVVWASLIPTGPTSQLYNGMAVTVNVNISQADNVLAVPQSAIFLVGGVPHVNVWSDKRSISTTVTTGLQGTSLIQITSGLSSGQQVVLSAFQGLPTATTVGG